MKCPICEKPVAPTDPAMPFCGDRCRLIDLGNWASEKYVISRPITDLDEVERGVNRQPRNEWTSED
jgi:endogenous inhibitor of DNA gyrase (YacG/DUF329 family)